MDSFRQRLARDEGFTLIELLVVLIIIGVLLAIAIPSYLGFQKSAQQTAAAADVRQAIPDAEAYFADNNTYSGAGFSALGLQGTYDSGLKIFAAGPPEVPGVVSVMASTAVDGTNAIGQEYCISAEDNGNWAAVAGPGGTVATKATSNPCTGWTKGISTTSDPTKFP